MDGQPTRKKSNRNGVEDIASSSVAPDGFSGDEGRMEDSLRNKDYFTPAVMDVRPKILDYVTDPEDVVSVMNASAMFSDFLKNQKAPALLALVLPILLKQNPIALAPHDVFKCRLLSKQMKASVDDLLANGRQCKFGYIRYDSWILNDAETIQAFMEGTQGFTGNPFLRRRCEVKLDCKEDDQLSNVMDILRRFGGDLPRVGLKISRNSSPQRALRVLKRALSYLPNVQRLELDLFEEHWPPYKTHASHTPFPSLKALRTFKLSSDVVDREFHVSLVRPILNTFGNQLTKLMIDDFATIDVPWGSLEFLNLLYLKVLFSLIEDSDEFSQAYTNLAKLNCPKLERLTVCGCRMGVTAETFLTLNKFKESLKTLQFTESLEEEIEPFQVDPLDIQEFPHVTRLTLCVFDVETPFRHLFRSMFTKLQELRFEPSGKFAYESPLPDENIRRSYFTIFPHLRQIAWIGEDRAETVFTR